MTSFIDDPKWNVFEHKALNLVLKKLSWKVISFTGGRGPRFSRFCHLWNLTICEPENRKKLQITWDKLQFKPNFGLHWRFCYSRIPDFSGVTSANSDGNLYSKILIFILDSFRRAATYQSVHSFAGLRGRESQRHGHARLGKARRQQRVNKQWPLTSSKILTTKIAKDISVRFFNNLL